MTESSKRAGTRAFSLALAALALGALSGCKGGDQGPDCKAVGAAYATLQRQEIEKAAKGSAAAASSAAVKQKEEALSLLPLLKEAMVKECQEKKWNEVTRRCVVDARTPEDLERCSTRAEEPAAQGADGEAAKKAAPEPSATPQKSDTP
jgi:hypothetical protein